MYESVKLICPSCSNHIHNEFKRLANGQYQCNFCGSVFTPETEVTSEIVSLLRLANERVKAREWLEAEDRYREVIEKAPDLPDAYWGLVLSRYCIEYVNDGGRYKPTCHGCSGTSIFEDANYKKLREILNNTVGGAEALKEYEERATQIEYIRKKVCELAEQKAPSEIFICFKKSDERGLDTVDTRIGYQIYNDLNEVEALKGKIFFAPESLKEVGGADYEPFIYKALETSKVMIVLGSKREYVTAQWTKNEWRRYLDFHKKEITIGKRKIIPVYVNEMQPNNFPIGLREKQGFFADVDLYKNIKKAIKPLFEDMANSTRSKYCLGCGTENPVNAKFCFECGEEGFVQSYEEYLKIKEKEFNERESQILAEQEEEKRKASEENEQIEKERAEYKAREENERRQKEEEERKARERQLKIEQECAELKSSAERFLHEDKVKESFNLYFKAAELGDPFAQKEVGCCYLEGQGITKSEQEAEKWFRLAVKGLLEKAGGGDPVAQYHLGTCYENGYGLVQDYKEAANWYKKAAEQNNSDAQFSLGMCYRLGNGVVDDFREAINWFSKAIDGFNKSGRTFDARLAELTMAKSYIQMPNIGEALKILRKLLDDNDAISGEAFYELGRLYFDETFDGIEEIKQDRIEGLKLFIKANRLGSPSAAEKLDEISENLDKYFHDDELYQVYNIIQNIDNNQTYNQSNYNSGYNSNSHGSTYQSGYNNQPAHSRNHYQGDLSILRKICYSFLSIVSVVVGFFIGILICGGMGSSGGLGILVTLGGFAVIVAFLIFTFVQIWKSRYRSAKLIVFIVLNAVITCAWVFLHLIFK